MDRILIQKNVNSIFNNKSQILSKFQSKNASNSYQTYIIFEVCSINLNTLLKSKIFRQYIIISISRTRSNKMHPNQYLNYFFLQYPQYPYYDHYYSQPTSQIDPNLTKNSSTCKNQDCQRPYYTSNKQSQSELNIKNPPSQSNAVHFIETVKCEEGMQESSYQKRVKIQVNPQQQLKKQNEREGRNANSNLLRMFFRKLDLAITSRSSNVDSVIAKYKMKTTLASFEEWFQINKVQHRKYISLPMIRTLFANGKKNQFEHKIMRVLLLQFLSNQAHIQLLTSKKIKRTNNKYQFKSCRNILSELC